MQHDDEGQLVSGSKPWRISDGVANRPMPEPRCEPTRHRWAEWCEGEVRIIDRARTIDLTEEGLSREQPMVDEFTADHCTDREYSKPTEGNSEHSPPRPPRGFDRNFGVCHLALVSSRGISCSDAGRLNFGRSEDALRHE